MKDKSTKLRNMPITKNPHKVPKGDGWTAKDIKESVEEMLSTNSVGKTVQKSAKHKPLWEKF